MASSEHLIGKHVCVLFSREREQEILGKYPGDIIGKVLEVHAGGIVISIEPPKDIRGGIVNAIFFPWTNISNVEIFENRPKR
jgi:hypothetical protein